VIILETPERAKSRQANIFASILGYATTTDGFDRIDPEPTGENLARAIQLALDDAGLGINDIDYICADGVATQIGDITETKAIKKVFGKRAYQIPVSAPKSMFGNLLGASGSVDLITTILAMENSTVPPTINLNNPDPECDLDYCPNKAQSKEIKKAMVISRGRGGINCVMIVEK
jgi:3-oxoacyl-[acyl-carrier-protein] synthase II